MAAFPDDIRDPKLRLGRRNIETIGLRSDRLTRRNPNPLLGFSSDGTVAETGEGDEKPAGRRSVEPE
jgi:hypothetical protein